MHCAGDRGGEKKTRGFYERSSKTSSKGYWDQTELDHGAEMTARVNSEAFFECQFKCVNGNA